MKSLGCIIARGQAITRCVVMAVRILMKVMMITTRCVAMALIIPMKMMITIAWCNKTYL